MLDTNITLLDEGLSPEQRIRLVEIGHNMLNEQTAEISITLRGIQECQKKHEDLLVTNGGVIAEIRDIMASVKAGFKVLGWLGHGVRWLGYIAAAGLAVYSAYHILRHGSIPPTKLP